jgi:hypothetical protein
LTPSEEAYLAEATALTAATIMGNSRGGLLDLECYLIQYGSIIVTLYYADGMDDGSAQTTIADSVEAGLFVAAGIQPSRFWVPEPTTVVADDASSNNATTTTPTTKANIPSTEVPLGGLNLTELGTNDARVRERFWGML